MPKCCLLCVVLCVLTALVLPRSASATTGMEAENRVNGFSLVAPTLVGGSHAASAGRTKASAKSFERALPEVPLENRRRRLPPRAVREVTYGAAILR